MTSYERYAQWCENLGIPPAPPLAYQDTNQYETNDVGLFRGANKMVLDMETGSITSPENPHNELLKHELLYERILLQTV